MKSLKSLLLLLCASCWAEDTAIIRPAPLSPPSTEATSYTVSVRMVREEPGIHGPLRVNFVRSANGGDIIDAHWDVALSDIVFKPLESQLASGTEITFAVNLPATVYKADESYTVSIPSIPLSSGSETRAEIVVSPGLNGNLLTDASGGVCRGGLMITLVGANVAEGDWKRVDAFFGKLEETPNAGLHLSVGSAGHYSDMPIRTLIRKTKVLDNVLLGSKYSVCINTIHALPTGTFNAILTFDASAPSPLPQISPIKQGDLDGRQTPSLKDVASAPGDVGDRSLERNLDLGLAYTQSRDLKTGQTSKLGVLDLRLAPLLDIKRRIGTQYLSRQTIPSWSWFLTPVYIDANVATGKIVDSTAALNRIAIGPQFEIRYMKLRTGPENAATGKAEPPLPRYPNVHRLILSANNYSDRDFKQLEYVAKFEYQPLLGILNRPRETRWTSIDDPVKKSVEVVKNVGWMVAPKLGTEIGNTYERRNPAEDVKPSDFVRRGYIGLDLSLEVTDHFTFSASDTLYLRGEISPSHFVNYIKLEVDLPLSSAFRETAQSFFLTYERGSLPPFEELNANVLRLGYRIRSENWFGFRR